MSWKERRLGDVLTLKRGYDLPEAQRRPGDVPVISSSGITGSHNIAMVAGPGVVTGRYGTMGEVFYVEGDYWPHNTALYVRDFKGNNPRFIAYFLKNALRGTNSNKAAVPGVNRNDLHERKVCSPDLETQGRIVEQLLPIDDLIENNRRRIALLEQSARLLYREWFVHLRFPGHEHVKVVDGVPEGWAREKLSDLVSPQYGFTETGVKERVGPKFLRGTDINKASYITWADVPYCQIDDQQKKKYQLNREDVVVIRMADPGKVAIVEDDIDAVFASYLIRFNLASERLRPYYLFYVLDSSEYQGYVGGSSTGATRKTANAGLLTSFILRVPPESLQDEFVASIKPMREQISILLDQNEKLRQARDLLLPRLMSGELVV